MAKRKILLVVEGEKAEKQLFEKLFSVYDLDSDYAICPYRTNIHELYDRMFANGDPENFSLLSVLKEKAEPSDKYIFDQDYSDILLVFDYDPHDNRFSTEHLVEMQSYFCESTDEGKLYINYPMVEACKHFRKMPDYEYLNRDVQANDIPRYKEVVGSESSYQSLTLDASKDTLNQMIALIAVKACLLARPGCNPLDTPELYFKINHLDVLVEQNRRMEDEGSLAVLGTCLLFVTDYSRELSELGWIVRRLFS